MLNEAIKSTRLDNQGFSAKSFRPTGATKSIAAGVIPEIVMKVGRWATKVVFLNNYVHKVAPASFTDNIVGEQSCVYFKAYIVFSYGFIALYSSYILSRHLTFTKVIRG